MLRLRKVESVANITAFVSPAAFDLKPDRTMTPLEVNSPERTSGTAAQALPGLRKVAGVFPLSLMQESVWFVEQMTPGTSAYNLVEGWQLEGKLEPAALQKSLDALERRHEALRTVFGQQGGKPVQIVLPPQGFALELTDLTQSADPEAELKARLSAQARRPFELTNGPLARANLYMLNPRRHLLLISMHHIISDEWSMNLFIRELGEHYRALV
jgi:condensation domain-containing protein